MDTRVRETEMDNEIIKKVVLQLGKKEVELTVEEAKKPHAALNEMFEQKVIREEHHHYPTWRWTYTYPWDYTGTVTVTPTIPVSTTPIWYSSSGGAVGYDPNSSSLMVNIN